MASLAPLQGSLGKQRAAHLLRRVSFRFTKNKVNQLAGMDASTAATLLLTPPPYYLPEPIYANSALTPPIPNSTWMTPGVPEPSTDSQLRSWVISWWLSEAYEDPGAMHKMIMFMHQYNIVASTSYRSTHFYDYLQLLRWGAFGNWKKFAYKMIFDQCMLRYLNNNSNSATNPQENFAREFLELFTIGKGPQAGPGDYTNYTEEDIVAAAQVLTGCRTQSNGARTTADPETSIPTGRMVSGSHNWNAKVFSNRLQNFTIPAVPAEPPGQRTIAKMTEELNAFVDLIFAQDETAKNFCRRLYRYYVNEKITEEIENDIIVPLANTLRNGNYEIKPVLKQLFSSEHFFNADTTSSVENVVGGVIKPPMENVMQSVSFFGLTLGDGTANPELRFRFFYSSMQSRMLTLAGFPIHLPSDVAGYPAYYQTPDYSHGWFNGSTVIARYKLPAMLLTGKQLIGSGNGTTNLGAKLDIVTWTKNSGFFTDPVDAYLLVQELLQYMLPKEVDEDRFNYFYNTVFLDNLPPADWSYEWENYLATNNSSEVKIPLERLVNAIMYSQEFQTY